MRLALAVLGALLLAGCSGPEGTGSGGESSTSTSSAPVLQDVPAEHPLGVTNGTPVLELVAGDWDVTFEGDGAEQFVLRLRAAMSPRGYSIGGQITMLILPIGYELGVCQPSELNFIASGVFGGNQYDDLPAGDYVVVVVFGEGASGSFSWQVGDSEEPHTLDANGEPSDWTRTAIEPTPAQGRFDAELPPGFHLLNVRANTGALSQSSSLHHEVGQGDQVCAEGDDAADVSPLGTTLSHTLHTESGTVLGWSGQFENTAVAPTDPPTFTVAGVVLSPPS